MPLILLSAAAPACTLWGAAGEASAEGSLLVKNRDWKPDHQQSLRLVVPDDGYRYLGLFADTGKYQGIKAGVNQAGLVVVSASASSLARSIREADRERHGILGKLLRRFGSLDEVAAHASSIFPQAKPVFLLLADPNGLMQVEIGQQGRFSIRRIQNGTLAHTNHYADTTLIDTPQEIGTSSQTRLTRIEALLAAGKQPWHLADFTGISQDRHDGADNSLWRDGKEYTLASWQMALPKQAPARLHLILVNPGQPELSRDLVLDKAFWQQVPGVLMP